ncbi:MAG: hypothetical protein WAM42_13020 [Candidatus Nitrosopolaris sp.]
MSHTNSIGRWVLLPNETEILAVHAALLHTGHIIYFSGDEFDEVIHNRNQL